MVRHRRRRRRTGGWPLPDRTARGHGSVNRFTGEYLALEPHSRIAFTFTHHSQTPEDRISDETVTVTLREVEPGRTEVTVTNSWTGPEFEPSYYEDLRSGWEEWVNRLEKMC
ncbi:SRPBCC family protein [Pseudonocardia xinjiangensis]|uniref:SRPBCC family protein n=1 Tax=Pseudonocardia xinjiangensis TaxID=75289 RepID=UPI003D8ED976